MKHHFNDLVLKKHPSTQEHPRCKSFQNPGRGKTQEILDTKITHVASLENSPTLFSNFYR